jgi:hypothetical protein
LQSLKLDRASDGLLFLAMRGEACSELIAIAAQC